MDVFEKSKKLALNEINLIQMCNSIRKLKAGLACLIENDSVKIQKTKYLYWMSSTIFLDEEEAYDIKSQLCNNFCNFLEEDDSKINQDIDKYLAFNNNKKSNKFKIKC